jgi:hypothetical protein
MMFKFLMVVVASVLVLALGCESRHEKWMREYQELKSMRPSTYIPTPTMTPTPMPTLSPGKYSAEYFRSEEWRREKAESDQSIARHCAEWAKGNVEVTPFFQFVVQPECERMGFSLDR